MEYQVGDKAVYPGHGVGVITDIEHLDIEGVKATVYVLKILDNGMSIRVPLENASALGMRRVMSPEQVDKAFEILRDWDVPADKQTWNRRFRQYTNQLHTGDPLEVSKVLRDLSLLRKSKTLSFGERKMYDKAHTLLIQEPVVLGRRSRFLQFRCRKIQCGRRSRCRQDAHPPYRPLRER